MPIEGNTGIVGRCSKCLALGHTNINVVSIATQATPGSTDGDFLCVFHNHPTAQALAVGDNN